MSQPPISDLAILIPAENLYGTLTAKLFREIRRAFGPGRDRGFLFFVLVCYPPLSPQVLSALAPGRPGPPPDPIKDPRSPGGPPRGPQRPPRDALGIPRDLPRAPKDPPVSFQDALGPSEVCPRAPQGVPGITQVRPKAGNITKTNVF